MAFEVGNQKIIVKEMPNAAELHECVAQAYQWFKGTYDAETGYAEELASYYYLAAALMIFTDYDMESKNIDDVIRLVDVNGGTALGDCLTCRLPFSYAYDAYSDKVRRLVNRDECCELAGLILNALTEIKSFLSSGEASKALEELKQAVSELAEESGDGDK